MYNFKFLCIYTYIFIRNFFKWTSFDRNLGGFSRNMCFFPIFSDFFRFFFCFFLIFSDFSRPTSRD
ncbi:hypothetical protein Hanom_Chr07g00671801 [Helianthus anomalus]